MSSVYYFNSGTSWVVPAGVTGIRVECYGSASGGFSYDNLAGNYPGGSYSKSNLINVTGGSTVHMNIGSAGGNTWFNTTNIAPTSASSTSSACLAVGGATAPASQIAANCGDVKHKGGNGLAVSGYITTAQGGQAGPDGNGADVVGQYTNVGLYNNYVCYSGGGANGGSSGSLGVPPYGISGTGTAGSGAYWNGTTIIYAAGTSYGGFIDPVGQYRYLNNVIQSNLTNYGPVGGSIVAVFSGGYDSSDEYRLEAQTGFIVITPILPVKYFTLTGSGTFNLPADWNDAANTIEVYGPGGNGATTASTLQSGGGGAGGGYVKAVNVPLKALEARGDIVTAKTYSVVVGEIFAGLWQGYQYDNDSTPSYGTLIRAGSGTSASGTSGTSGGTGSCIINNVSYATISRTGGSGGAGRSSSTAAGGGGGGAAGPNGDGGAGGSNTTTLNTTGRGGGGGNGGGAGSGVSATAGTAGTGAGAGGTGGAANSSGGAGAAGTSVYSGGGGGGAGDGNTTAAAGAGGRFGGGGGGSASAAFTTAGAGSPGIIIITYTPVVTVNSNFFMFF